MVAFQFSLKNLQEGLKEALLLALLDYNLEVEFDSFVEGLLVKGAGTFELGLLVEGVEKTHGALLLLVHGDHGEEVRDVGSRTDLGAFNANQAELRFGVEHLVDVVDGDLADVEEQHPLVLVLGGQEFLHVELVVHHVDLGLLQVEGSREGQPDVPGIHPVLGEDQDVFAEQQLQVKDLGQVGALAGEAGQQPEEEVVEGIGVLGLAGMQGFEVGEVGIGAEDGLGL